MKTLFEFLNRTECYLVVTKKITFKDEKIFAKNFFVNDLKTYNQYIDYNKNEECYITYNTFNTKDNRKLENCRAITMVALDIEFVKKQKPEDSDYLELLYDYVESFASMLRLTDYAIVHSGNGFHLYMPIKAIKLNSENITHFQYAYNALIYELDIFFRQHTKQLATCLDRKDINGVLRIPDTVNLSARRRVQMRKIVESCEIPNKNIRSRLNKLKNKYIKQLENKRERHSNYSDLSEEYFFSYDNIIINLLLDDSLEEPEYGGWYSNVIFALQGLIYLSDARFTKDVLDLQSEYNMTWNTNVNLNDGGESIESIRQCYAIVYNFCKNNNYEKYCKAIAKILAENGTKDE